MKLTVKQKKKLALEFMKKLVPDLQDLFNLNDWRFFYKLTSKNCEEWASIDVYCRMKEAVIYLNPYMEAEEEKDILFEWGISLVHELAHCLLCSTWDIVKIILNSSSEDVRHYLFPIVNEIYERDIESIAKVLINMEEVHKSIERVVSYFNNKLTEGGI